MTIQIPESELSAVIERSNLNTAPPTHSSAQRHYMRLTLEGGEITRTLECRHTPVTSEWSRCAGEDADEFGSEFFEWFAGAESAPLCSGLIDIWWEGSSEDSELYWDYAAFVRPTTRGRKASPAASASIDISLIDTVGIVTFDASRLPSAAIVEHKDEVHRILAIGDQDIERGHGGNVDLYNEGF